MGPVGFGALAGLATAASWAVCARAFGSAGERVGSVAVNHIRLVGGVGLLTLLHLVLIGSPLPLVMDSHSAMLFAASGIVGLTLGDACLFRAWVLVGPAMGTLMMTTAPAWAALLAWGFLGEKLGSHALLGMFVTLVGVGLTASTRLVTTTKAAASSGSFLFGLFLAGLGALGQGAGVVLAKPALANAPALSGTWLRMLVACVALWAFTGVACLVRRQGPGWLRPALADKTALKYTAVGTIAGPALGVWLSLVATKLAPVGIATTLMALTPVLLLLAEWKLDQRRPNLRELLGAAVAVAGVVLLLVG